MTRVTIELEFDDKKNGYEINDAEVYGYLKELMANDMLVWQEVKLDVESK